MQAAQLESLFRAKLRSRRLELGMTQAALANKIGAQQPYIADLEHGKRTPTLQTLAKLSEALGVDPADLLSLATLDETF